MWSEYPQPLMLCAVNTNSQSCFVEWIPTANHVMWNEYPQPIMLWQARALRIHLHFLHHVGITYLGNSTDTAGRKKKKDSNFWLLFSHNCTVASGAFCLPSLIVQWPRVRIFLLLATAHDDTRIVAYSNNNDKKHNNWNNENNKITGLRLQKSDFLLHCPSFVLCDLLNEHVLYFLSTIWKLSFQPFPKIPTSRQPISVHCYEVAIQSKTGH